MGQQPQHIASMGQQPQVCSHSLKSVLVPYHSVPFTTQRKQGYCSKYARRQPRLQLEEPDGAQAVCDAHPRVSSAAFRYLHRWHAKMLPLNT